MWIDAYSPSPAISSLQCMQKYAFAILSGIELENCFLVPSVCLIQCIQIIVYNIDIFNYEMSLEKNKNHEAHFYSYYLFSGNNKQHHHPQHDIY